MGKTKFIINEGDTTKRGLKAIINSLYQQIYLTDEKYLKSKKNLRGPKLKLFDEEFSFAEFKKAMKKLKS